MRIYKNYDQVDEDLKILKLQKRIDEEKIKLNVEDLKEEFRPVNILTGIMGKIAKRAVIVKSAAKIVGGKKP